jgi:gluconokinase
MHRIHGGSDGVVLTCSALKRKYRDVIRVAAYYDQQLLIHFIYLDADEEMLLKRVAARQNHYMGANMVHSQFADLERPMDDEKDVIKVDVSQTLDGVKAEAASQVLELMNRDVKTE